MCKSGTYCFFMLVLLVSVAVIGCNRTPSTSSNEAGDTHATGTSNELAAEIAAALAELSEVDRRAAEAQKFCAVEQGSLLGSMGAPFKVMIDDKPVFLCCEGCKEAALANPKETLAAIQELKAANDPSGPSKSADPE